MTNLIEIQGLTKDYSLTASNRKKKIKDAFVVDNVSFDVPKGYIMGFIGPNGAGKTTVIKLMLQIKKADKGRVRIFNEEGTHNNEHIGVVLDTPHFPVAWTVKQVEKALSPFYKEWDKARFAACLAKFDLDPKKTVHELSRGMQVKLQIAIALSHNARLLILDEPTSGLDPVARDEICELLQEFVEDGERSVLFSTHITSDLEKVADYITMILDGRIHFSGSKESLMEKYARVAGGTEEVPPALILGYRKHRSGFEGLVEKAHANRLPATVLTEAASLEEIIVFLNREAKREGGEDNGKGN
ncbi:MAG: ABC transporter ATP-binding protein [Defluviitaleaceae bacterium]|nr:ABC transporter ATP-binding protein [Defluviitaleaceae bacterium]MCL2240190.1 ABC transporter ATP-binding protein [Defluviitaleaceae bacterium]MCL2240863.1 ABC transporter ATP-binding protein [Defluviitaleaceae bacterium]